MNERVIFCFMQICEQPCVYVEISHKKKKKKNLEIRGLTGVLN